MKNLFAYVNTVCFCLYFYSSNRPEKLKNIDILNERCRQELVGVINCGEDEERSFGKMEALDSCLYKNKTYVKYREGIDRKY